VERAPQTIPPRHPEVRAQRASKGDGRPSFESRAKARPPQDDGAKESKRITRSDTIADRRGRKIPVTRTRTEKPERPPSPKQRGGKARRPDRARGPRPSRPR
jgi:hypothetical protein